MPSLLKTSFALALPCWNAVSQNMFKEKATSLLKQPYNL